MIWLYITGIILLSGAIIRLRIYLRRLSTFRKQAERHTRVRFYVTGRGWIEGEIKVFYDDKIVRVRTDDKMNNYIVPVKSLKPPKK